jgi:hypothetical protein
MRSEIAILNDVRLEASELGIKLWRNNLGATYTSHGDFIRYGLANDSVALNAVLKSSDLIGIRPIVITSKHMGMTIGQFVSREIKFQGWQFRGTDRELAQKRWIDLIQSHGGDAKFVTERGSF